MVSFLFFLLFLPAPGHKLPSKFEGSLEYVRHYLIIIRISVNCIPRIHWEHLTRLSKAWSVSLSTPEGGLGTQSWGTQQWAQAVSGANCNAGCLTRTCPNAVVLNRKRHSPLGLSGATFCKGIPEIQCFRIKLSPDLITVLLPWRNTMPHKGKAFNWGLLYSFRGLIMIKLGGRQA